MFTQHETMCRARPRSLAPRSRSHLEFKSKKNVVFTLCLSHHTHFCVPCHIAGASVCYAHNSSLNFRHKTTTTTKKKKKKKKTHKFMQWMINNKFMQWMINLQTDNGRTVGYASARLFIKKSNNWHVLWWTLLICICMPKIIKIF